MASRPVSLARSCHYQTNGLHIWPPTRGTICPCLLKLSRQNKRTRVSMGGCEYQNCVFVSLTANSLFPWERCVRMFVLLTWFLCCLAVPSQRLIRTTKHSAQSSQNQFGFLWEDVSCGQCSGLTPLPPPTRLSQVARGVCQTSQPNLPNLPDLGWKGG